MNTTHTASTDPSIVTERHWAIAMNLPTCEAFTAYCEARLAGRSHLYAMHAAMKAGK